MSTSLPGALAWKVRVLPFGDIPGAWAFIIIFCFALQSTGCLSQEHSQRCGDKVSCAEGKELDPGCSESRPCPVSPPTPCPPGTFLSGAGPHNAPVCDLCPPGFFNHWPDQNACFPCGSEATQPEEGQDTCVCRGPGRVFQPSDGQCPCPPGHRDSGEPRGCVQQEYQSCKDGTARNQEGLCLTKSQWDDHCAQEVCVTPGDAHGYDPSLGLCLCRAQHSSGMCGSLCSEEQRHILHLGCQEGIPQIVLTEGIRSQVFYLPDKPSSPRTVGHPCNMHQTQKDVPLYVVQMDELGFLGLTRPGGGLLHSLGLPITDPSIPGQDPGKSMEGLLTSPRSWHLNFTQHGDLLPAEPGIRNPTVCLQTNDTLAFLVTHDHYPKYDLDHFYNTLEDFDWGHFRALAEESQLHHQSPQLFLQQFQQPGVYVFHLSSNQHRKMYIRTLPPGGQCFGEGPFAPTTPRYLMQTGIAKIPRPLKRCDWPAILGELILLLGLCLLLLIQCHSWSWARKAAPYPTFRKHQQGYNLDAYTSPRTEVTAVRRGQSHQVPGTPRTERVNSGSWGTEEQVDLEWFDTETFFGILLRQSLSVTAKLSQTKEELKLLYLKLVSEVRSLRQLWSTKHCTLASTDQLLGNTQEGQRQAAEAAGRAAEEEARRRGNLAGEYAESLSHQLELLRLDLQARQEQWASFCSALMAAQRLLKTRLSSSTGKSVQPVKNSEGAVSQLDTVLGRLSQAVLQEGHRLRAWGVLGTGTGAELLQPASAGPPGASDVISINPITKLMVPGPNCTMLPASGHESSIPPGYFIHPDTKRVMPEAGNLGYDLLRATLVPTADSSAGEVRTSEAAILPYVPYPTCPATGSPTVTCLPALQPRRTSQLGALMSDPITGIEVPVLAVTLHPQTRQCLTLGGTYCNPLTQTLAPLELGGPMEDPETGDIAPILGVSLDENTGKVLALGGLHDASGKLLLPGDSFVEPLSRKTVRLQGAYQHEGRTLPQMGGPQALLDANVLVAQTQVIVVLQQWQESPGSKVQGLLEAAIENMRRALALNLHHVLQQIWRLERQLKTADSIKASGGRLGMMCYPGTELWVPALYGMEIPDPEGSGLMVPILGMERDGNSGSATPLAGSMEEANGKGLVPISIGAHTIDPLTGEPGPVIGVQMDRSVRVVVPVVQVLEFLPRGVRDPDLLDILERELRARGQYWHHQEQEEEQLMEHLEKQIQELLCTPTKDIGQQLRSIEEACTALESCYLQETERRARALSMHSGPELGLLSQADKEEWKQEAQVALGIRNVLQSLEQTAEKFRQAVGRQQGHVEEMWLQQSQIQCPQIWKQPMKVVQHLSHEFQEMMRERQSFLDSSLCKLQFRRELSRFQLLHIQMVASGSPVCLENYPGDRFYGTNTTSFRDRDIACPLLVPFLRSLTSVLLEAQGHGLGPEDQRPETNTDKTDYTWASLLFSTLKNVDIWSQAHKKGAELHGQVYHKPDPKSSMKDLPKLQTLWKGELVIVQSADLSAREFVVYQYGLSTLHLLIPQLHAPEITLQIASDLPAMQVSGNAFQGSFFYQSAESKLFVRRECLASVGNFVLLLIHCLAHITAEDLHQDSNPAFLRLFYQGLKVYFKKAFSITLQMSAVSWDNNFDPSISTILLEEQPISEKQRDLLSKLIERKCVSRLEPESLEEYIKKNKDLLLLTNMENFLKSILAAEKQILREPEDQFGSEDKL